MKKKILFCIVFILGFIRPINAAKLYTTHWSNKPVVFYIVDTLGRHRNRVIVYPNNQNKGISVTYLSERHDSFAIKLPFEGEICYCDKSQLSFALESDKEMYPYENDSWPIALKKGQEIVLLGVDNDKIYGESEINSTKVYGWLYESFENIEQIKSNAFSIHNNGESLVLYSDQELTRKRIELFPYEQEGNAGIMLHINKAVGDILEIQVNDETVYCQVGSLYTNTRNYNGGRLFLFSEPTNESSIIGITTIEQAALVMDAHGTWLKVQCIDEYDEPIVGWIPSNMQCPSPWTTCN